MSQQSFSEQVLNWRREEPIAVPSPDRERRMAIRYSDWKRLKRRLSRVADPVPRLSVVYSVLFGIATSSGLSIIPIATSYGLSWVTSLYICVCVFSLLCGCVFVWIDRKVRSGRESDLEDIEADMKEIESMFELQTMGSVKDEISK